jgi:CHASE3 domain sensor protein
MAFTPQDIINLINQTGEIVKDTIDKANNSSTSAAIKDELISNANDLQNFVNIITSGTGVATEQQLNQLDEQLRQQKLRLLQVEAQQTQTRFAWIVGGTIVGIVALFFITRKKKAI